MTPSRDVACRLEPVRGDEDGDPTCDAMEEEFVAGAKCAGDVGDDPCDFQKLRTRRGKYRRVELLVWRNAHLFHASKW